MKALRTSFSRAGLLWFWATLTALVAFSLLAIVPSQIQIGSPRMSFFECLTQANWRGLLLDSESSLAAVALFVVVVVLLFYSCSQSTSVRVSLLLLLLAGPALAFSDKPKEFLLWFVRMPYAAIIGTVNALLGHGNGQFYRDGPFLLAALGWWTLFCLMLLFREGALAWKIQRSAEPAGRANRR